MTPRPAELVRPSKAEADWLKAERIARMRKGTLGSVHSWELVTAVDGPGTRLTFFLSGCSLRCQYCQNPDTWQIGDGEPKKLSRVLKRIDRYRVVLQATGGGVTLSGGEPLLQHAFVSRILRHCKEIGVHTAIDTSGYLGALASDELLDDVDLVLLDVKSGLPATYREVTTRSLAPTLRFGRRLATRGQTIWVRFVLVPGLTDAEENVDAVAEYVASLQALGLESAGREVIERVEVLPFHQMGRDKWDALGMRYELADTLPPDPALVERVRRQFRARGLLTY